MEKTSDIEGFFVENGDKFTEEQLMRSIGRLKKYAKLIGRDGRVHIEDKNLSGTDKLKVFLITRYLGAELGKVKPETKIDQNIKSINMDDIASFLSVDKDNARARMSALVQEGFARRPVKGKIEVEPFQVERFLDQLENGINQTKSTDQKAEQKSTAQQKPRRPKKIEPKPQIDPASIYERLSNDLKIDTKKLQDNIYIKEDGSFKFNSVLGESRYAKQKNCLLMSAYVFLMGFSQTTFTSRNITDICINSMVDHTNLNQTIKQLKKQELISKEGRRSQSNIIREKGKEIAREELKKLCS
jgi:hypothetical protein